MTTEDLHPAIPCVCAGCARIVVVPEAQAAEPVFCSDDCRERWHAGSTHACPGCGNDIPLDVDVCAACADELEQEQQPDSCIDCGRYATERQLKDNGGRCEPCAERFLGQTP